MAIANIDDTSFLEKIAAGKSLVIKFYADWCGSCKLFSPKFRRLSEETTLKDLEFVEIDAESNPEARKLAGVNNLPFVAVIKGGKLLEGVATNKEELVREMAKKLIA